VDGGKVVSLTQIATTNVSHENQMPRQLTPAQVVPLPKVPQTGPRQTRMKNRGSSRVLTSTPEMNRIRQGYMEKIEKENIVISKKSANAKKKKPLEMSNTNASNIKTTIAKQKTRQPQKGQTENGQIIGISIEQVTRRSTRQVNRKLITQFSQI
jgi:hypothetical protein